MMASSDFIIRPASASDVDELSALAHRIWREHYTPIIGRDQVEYMLGLWYGVDFLLKQVADKDRLFLVLEQMEKLKGYIQSSEQKGHTFIHKLYIAPESQGQGMGSALLGALPKHLPIRLRVNRNNIDSIAFYKRHRFEIIAEDVLDIGEGYAMDDYIMRRPISSS